MSTGLSSAVIRGSYLRSAPGRPFADLVAYLRDSGGGGGNVAELTIGRRLLPRGADADVVRDDIAVASLFSIDAALPAADEALARVIQGSGDHTLDLVTWEDEEDLHRKLSTTCARATSSDFTPATPQR